MAETDAKRRRPPQCEPHAVVCPDCGVEFITKCRTRPVRCPKCRVLAQRAHKREWYKKFKEEQPEELKARASRYSKTYRKNHPEFILEINRKWKAARRAEERRIREEQKAQKALEEAKKKEAEAIAAREIEAFLGVKRQKAVPKPTASPKPSTRSQKEPKKKTAPPEHTLTGNAFMSHAAAIGQLQYCERLRVKMMHLPCGQRDECFAKTRCDRCPAKSKRPSFQFNTPY